MEDTLLIGVITTVHGVRGEVKVFPTTDDVKRFKKCKDVILHTKNEDIPLTIESCKFFKNQVILKFKEFNNRDEVEKFRQCDLLVTRENAVPLKEGEYFICDIIGATVNFLSAVIVCSLSTSTKCSVAIVPIRLSSHSFSVPSNLFLTAS